MCAYDTYGLSVERQGTVGDGTLVGGTFKFQIWNDHTFSIVRPTSMRGFSLESNLGEATLEANYTFAWKTPKRLFHEIYLRVHWTQLYILHVYYNHIAYIKSAPTVPKGWQFYTQNINTIYAPVCLAVPKRTPLHNLDMEVKMKSIQGLIIHSYSKSSIYKIA